MERLIDLWGVEAVTGDGMWTYRNARALYKRVLLVTFITLWIDENALRNVYLPDGD